MFDELRDREPPEPDMGKLQAVTARAKQLRTRRYAAMGLACAVLFAAGAGAVLAVNGSDGELAPSETDPPITTTIESTFPGTTIPPGSTTPGTGTTVPATSAPPATDPPTTDAPTTAPPPAVCVGPTSGLLAVRDGDAVRVAPDGSSEVVATAEQAGGTIRRALQAPDGVLWLEVVLVGVPRGGGRNDRVVGVFRDGALGWMRTGQVTLHAVGTLNDRSVAAITNSANPEANDVYGTFEMIDSTKTVVAAIPDPYSHTGSVWSVSIVNDVIGVGRVDDLGEGFIYYDATGSPIDRYDPNTNGTPDDPSDDRIQYSMAPDPVQPFQLSRSDVAWLEGPGGGFKNGDASGRRVGNWQLVIADQASGDERLRMQIGGVDEDFRSADTDGRWLVVNFGDFEERQLESPPSRSVIIDLSDPEPTPLDVCDGFTDVALTRS